jgi:hypothetical protein
MNRQFRWLLSAICLQLAILQPSWASTTYFYTGNHFTSITDDIWLPVPGQYTTAMHVSGWFEVENPLASNLSLAFVTPVSYSFSDGRSTYTNLDAVLSTANSFEISTDAAGSITGWFIGIQRFGTGNLWTVTTGPVYDYGAVEPNWFSPTTQRDNAIVYNNPGAWTSVTAPVPEPASYAMLLAGLGLFGAASRRGGQRS